MVDYPDAKLLEMRTLLETGVGAGWPGRRLRAPPQIRGMLAVWENQFFTDSMYSGCICTATRPQVRTTTPRAITTSMLIDEFEPAIHSSREIVCDPITQRGC